uniref:Uncharacterized protein n=1 Tax=Rhizophora mucronata TaxID=61149 RepID=A0A2P2NKP6_RHIMU
MNPKFIPMTNW